MVEAIHDDIFRLEIPLPDNPLRSLNAYCVKGGERHLLIDTGFNRPECRAALFEGLARLAIDTRTCDILVTHRHADHAGLALEIAGPDATLWAHPLEAEAMNFSVDAEANWQTRLPYLLASGLSPDEANQLRGQHPGVQFGPSRVAVYQELVHGQVLAYGNRTLTVIHVPGHTPGQVTLYEPELRLYFSADHVLGDITPNITRWPGVTDSLGDYLASLDAIRGLDARLVLPGHRSLVTNLAGRVRELRDHHAARLDEVRAILREGESTGYAVASRMTWALRNIAWPDFPVRQKWFATGEALSHLDHLAALGETQVTERGGLRIYSLAA